MMDIEKLIERLKNAAGGPDGIKMCQQAATALSTFQIENQALRNAANGFKAENARLREELEYEREHANAYHEECGQWEAENEKLRAELEQVKAALRREQE